MALRVFLGGLVLSVCACAPQVVDAVDSPLGAGGATSGAGSGAGGSGGVGAPGGLGAVGCVGSKSLVHRYKFDGSGTVVRDADGGPDGTVVGTSLTGQGTVTLAGRMTDQYVDLPNGILSALDSATLEVWLTWAGGHEWQRIFDFGDDQSGVEGAQSSGATYLFLTPRITDDGGALLRVAYQRTSYPEVQLDATRALPTGTLTHVAVTFDAGRETLAVYIDGELENALTTDAVPIRLSVLNDINNWLGRSQYAADPELAATIEEFRIHARALGADELESSFEAGPNPSCLDDRTP